jgi:hypothetical protein
LNRKSSPEPLNPEPFTTLLRQQSLAASLDHEDIATFDDDALDFGVDFDANGGSIWDMSDGARRGVFGDGFAHMSDEMLVEVQTLNPNPIPNT